MSCSQPFFWMNNERRGGQAYEMAAARRTECVVYKNLTIQEPLDVLGFESI